MHGIGCYFFRDLEASYICLRFVVLVLRTVGYLVEALVVDATDFRFFYEDLALLTDDACTAAVGKQLLAELRRLLRPLEAILALHHLVRRRGVLGKDLRAILVDVVAQVVLLA